jgi:hypothetical protein
MTARSVECVEGPSGGDSRTRLRFGEDDARIDGRIHSLHRMMLSIPVAARLAGLGLSIDYLDEEKG